MDSSTKTLIAVLIAVVLFKFLLGSRVDRKADLPSLLRQGALLIDVRTPGEFAAGHVEGAINVPLDQLTEKIGRRAKKKSTPIIVYCHSGSRSGMAKKLLLRQGYEQVVNGGSLHRMRAILRGPSE